MKFGSMKKKIVVGVTALSLVSGAGVAFASTNVGAELAVWYNVKFATSFANATTSLAQHVASAVPGLNQEKVTLKNETVGRVAAAGDKEVTDRNSAINAHKNAYITTLNETETNLTNAMDGRFAASVAITNGTINHLVGVEAGKTQTEISSAVNSQGTTSVSNVEQQVGATKTAAIKELEVEIAATKAELERLLAEKSAAASEAMKKNFDDEIAAKRTAITNAIALLEQAKKVAITTKGSEIETAAKAELDALVNGISPLLP
jgi:hypothetical protein